MLCEIASEFSVNEEYIGKAQGDDWFTLQFRNEGESVEVFSDVGQIHGQNSRCYVTILPRGLEQGSWIAHMQKNNRSAGSPARTAVAW